MKNQRKYIIFLVLIVLVLSVVLTAFQSPPEYWYETDQWAVLYDANRNPISGLPPGTVLHYFSFGPVNLPMPVGARKTCSGGWLVGYVFNWPDGQTIEGDPCQ